MGLIESFFRLDILIDYTPMILKGMVVTLKLAATVIVTGLAGGLILSLLRTLGVRIVNIPIMILVDVFRAMPPLMVIIVLYFALPFAGIKMSGFVAVWMALGLKLTAYAEEIFYGSILSVSKGQIEAARASGLTFAQTMRHVVLPPALRMSIPPLTNRTVGITKGTALGTVVAVPEILSVATDVQALVYNTTPLTMAAIAYLLIFFPFVVLSRWLETRYAWRT